MRRRESKNLSSRDIREQRRGSIAKCIGARIMRYLLLLLSLTFDLSPQFVYRLLEQARKENHLAAM